MQGSTQHRCGGPRLASLHIQDRRDGVGVEQQHVHRWWVSDLPSRQLF
ncbi:hypothetical protein DB30_03576 [Enhygromyxa salina]|uniref:Uncharacterized protein n=1 Tax=Enhygromyxa salina TaxID=215803 RepID=A0A0C2CP45_9BACT|nr:hypothetical protein DB30_03576 [Enhygromyxa salina]